MAEFTFYTVAMSRGQISRWALHEAGADYEHVVFDWATRPDSFKAINPMNKVPALVHHHGGHDHAVTECAAINHYLAETHPDKGLLPDAHEKAASFRWLFFAAGPLEGTQCGAFWRRFAMKPEPSVLSAWILPSLRKISVLAAPISAARSVMMSARPRIVSLCGMVTFSPTKPSRGRMWSASLRSACATSIGM